MLSFTTETWRIEDTKNSESQTIHLPKEAVEILTERKWKSESPWVFPGNGASGHFADPKKAWMRILKEAGIDNLRIHDLRRTLGSCQAATGANGYIIGKTRQNQELKFPIMTISIAVVTNPDGKQQTNHVKVGEIAAELKEHAKSLSGSVFVVNRRGKK